MATQPLGEASDSVSHISSSCTVRYLEELIAPGIDENLLLWRNCLFQQSSRVADDPAIAHCFSAPQDIAFPTENGTLDLRIQYWTSRGIAVVDVNDGGSTGYGRDYRERLKQTWGMVDVDDGVNAVKYLCQAGLADAQRVIITGGSAGGYTTLAALAFRDFFKGGGSHYGVSDAEALAKDTHKCESHYCSRPQVGDTAIATVYDDRVLASSGLEGQPNTVVCVPHGGQGHGDRSGAGAHGMAAPGW